MNFGRAAFAPPFLRFNRMAKKRKQPFKDSRSFALMNVWPEEQRKSVSASLRRFGESSALSACAGMEAVSKREVNEQARRAAERASNTEVLNERARGAAPTPTSIAVSPPKLGEAVRREHLAWLRWARRADEAASGGLKKMRKSMKRKLRNDGQPRFVEVSFTENDGLPRFDGGSQLSQGGLPTLGKRR